MSSVQARIVPLGLMMIPLLLSLTLLGLSSGSSPPVGSCTKTNLLCSGSASQITSPAVGSRTFTNTTQSAMGVSVSIAFLLQNRASIDGSIWMSSNLATGTVLFQLWATTSACPAVGNQIPRDSNDVSSGQSAVGGFAALGTVSAFSFVSVLTGVPLSSNPVGTQFCFFFSVATNAGTTLTLPTRGAKLAVVEV